MTLSASACRSGLQEGGYICVNVRLALQGKLYSLTRGLSPVSHWLILELSLNYMRFTHTLINVKLYYAANISIELQKVDDVNDRR